MTTENKNSSGWTPINQVFKSSSVVRPTAYRWQEFALDIIRELGVPGYKKSAVFKVYKEFPKNTVQRALNDTKELCPSGPKWKYFFKIINNQQSHNDSTDN